MPGRPCLDDTVNLMKLERLGCREHELNTHVDSSASQLASEQRIEKKLRARVPHCFGLKQ